MDPPDEIVCCTIWHYRILREAAQQDRSLLCDLLLPPRPGFLPGTQDEKNEPFESPYKDILADLLGRPNSYVDLKEAGLLSFMTSAHVRGLT